jgi:hypothetical protein
VALVAGSFTGDYLKKALPKERVAAVRHGKQQTANGKGARTNGAKIGVTSNGAGSTKGVGARLASPASGRNGAKPANTKKRSTTKVPAKAR